MGAAPYDPINVYKPVATDIGVVDGLLECLTVAGVRLPLPFTTRMTVVRLSNGDLFLHSPTKFDRKLADELEHLGRIQHLISPNQFHYAHIGEWLEAFPDAVAWASPGVRRRSGARHIEIRFGRDLDLDPPDEWRNEQLRPSRNFTNGGLAASCSVTGAASTWMQTTLSAGF